VKRKTKEFKRSLLLEIDKRNIDLRHNSPEGFNEEMAKKFGKTVPVIIDTVSKLRKEQGIPSPYGRSASKKKLAELRAIIENKLYQTLVELKLFRGSPGKEIKICNEIREILENLSVLGPTICAYLGTPTPLCVSPDNKTYKGKILDDNLELAKAMYRLFDKLYIGIGNLVNPVKAETKKCHFKMFLPGDVRIWTLKLHEEGFRKEVERLIKLNPRKDVVVVFMGSGVWKGTTSEYSFSTNFERAAKYLVKTYSNLRIIAMRTGRGHYEFKVECLGFDPDRLLQRRVKNSTVIKKEAK